jgi:hypothetical protein
MARDFLFIGSSPPDEECVQVGQPGAEEECKRYIELLRATMGPEPPRTRLGVKWQGHDFGAYCEVVCRYDDEDDDSIAYAMKCEGEGPATWDAPRLWRFVTPADEFSEGEWVPIGAEKEGANAR